MKRILISLAVGAIASSAAAQSFNVDISADGMSAPSDSFGAAAGQKGYWNNILNPDDDGSLALKTLDGSASSVSVNFPGIGIVAKRNAFSGDYAKLMSDFHYTSDANQSLWYNIDGLAAGTYIVYAYSNRPDDNGDSSTLMSINGGAGYVSGTMQANVFDRGVTHAVRLVQVFDGNPLTIGAMKSDLAGVISGFQIVKIPTAARIYVDASAAGKGDGSTWSNAFTNLWGAMWAAKIAGQPSEIWVADGSYTATPDNSSDGARTDSFMLANNVKVYGGFAGHESSLDERQPQVNLTVLSGMLGDDDGYMDNTYHIVHAKEVNASAVLDGFMIYAGFADDDSGMNANGPGMLIQDADPTLRNCVFTSSQCKGSGGAVYVEGDSEPTFSGCDFYNNYCLGYGGAIRFVGKAGTNNIPKIWNSRFIRNGCAQSGAAINVTDRPIWVFNSVYIGNFADAHAGAVRCWGEDADAYFGNCTFYGNDADSVGGIEAAAGADVEIRNSIFYANSDDDGATNKELAQVNTYQSDSSLRLKYNLIDGWTGNLGGEENFTDAPKWANIFGVDGNFGTLDDDVRLSSTSACIDRGSDNLVFGDWLDLDGDNNDSGEKTPFDLYGASRVVDDPDTANYQDGLTMVDVGAAEFNPVAPGDMNCDGSVDFDDIDPFVLAVADPDGYSAAHPGCNYLNGDINRDGSVDFDDIDAFVACIADGGCK